MVLRRCVQICLELVLAAMTGDLAEPRLKVTLVLVPHLLLHIEKNSCAVNLDENPSQCDKFVDRKTELLPSYSSTGFWLSTSTYHSCIPTLDADLSLCGAVCFLEPRLFCGIP